MSEFQPVTHPEPQLGRNFDTCNIVIQGSLYIKRPPPHGLLRLKAWQKRYFVLIDEILDTNTDRRRLEMYRDEADLSNMQTDRYVLPLTDVTYVGLNGDSKRFRHVFSIICSGCSPIYLAGISESYVSEWVIALKLITGTSVTGTPISPGLLSDGSGSIDFDHLSLGSRKTYEDKSDSNEHSAGSYCAEIKELGRDYEITVVPTDISVRNQFFGEYILQVSSRGVSLNTIDINEVVYWPLCYIRKFESQRLKGSDSKLTLVTLEVGRRCATGEGIFQFKSRKGREIVRDIRDTALTATARRQLTSRLLRSEGPDGTTSSRSTPSIARRRNPIFRSLTALKAEPLESTSHRVSTSLDPEEIYVPVDYIEPNNFLDQFIASSNLSFQDRDVTTSCSTGSGSTLSGQADYIMLMNDTEPTCQDKDRNFFTNAKNYDSKEDESLGQEAYIDILPTSYTTECREESQNIHSPKSSMSKESTSELMKTDSTSTRKDAVVSVRSKPIMCPAKEGSYPFSTKTVRSSKAPVPLPRPQHTMTAQSMLIHNRTSSVSSQSKTTRNRAYTSSEWRTSSERENLRTSMWQKLTGPPIVNLKLKASLSSKLSL